MGEYVCPSCNKIYLSASNLSRHKSTVCNKRVIICPCGSEFTRKDKLNIHQKTCNAAKLKLEIEQLRLTNKELSSEITDLSSENKELLSENKELSSENNELRSRPVTVVNNNYYNIQVVADGLIEHIDENIIYDAMCEELKAADYMIDTTLDVQKIVFNTLIQRVTSSNKRTRNMVYNIMKNLAYRDVSTRDHVLVGTSRTLVPEYQKQYDNRKPGCSHRDHRSRQDKMDIWYNLLLEKPSQFMEPILRKLHVQNYLLRGEEGVEYTVPPRLTYKDPFIEECTPSKDELSEDD